MFVVLLDVFFFFFFKKVCRYITEQANVCQFIVISLKDAFFSQADALIGVYKDNDGESSKTLSIDLLAREEQMQPQE
jgi:structural maintenance of chromosome 1